LNSRLSALKSIPGRQARVAPLPSIAVTVSRALLALQAKDLLLYLRKLASAMGSSPDF